MIELLHAGIRRAPAKLSAGRSPSGTPCRPPAGRGLTVSEAREEATIRPAPIPASFGEYLRSLGPGIVVALTWLGAGDIVDASVAGGAYGYALMWALALALVVRWLFVSTIARYQLCNERGEIVLQGLQ